MQKSFVIQDCPGRYGPKRQRGTMRSVAPKTLGQNFRGVVCQCDKHNSTYTVKPDGTLTTPIVAKEAKSD